MAETAYRAVSEPSAATQGQEAAAYALLAPVYQGFTEGFDTADLQEAKALLETCES